MKIEICAFFSKFQSSMDPEFLAGLEVGAPQGKGECPSSFLLQEAPL